MLTWISTANPGFSHTQKIQLKSRNIKVLFKRDLTLIKVSLIVKWCSCFACNAWPKQQIYTPSSWMRMPTAKTLITGVWMSDRRKFGTVLNPQGCREDTKTRTPRGTTSPQPTCHPSFLVFCDIYFRKEHMTIGTDKLAGYELKKIILHSNAQTNTYSQNSSFLERDNVTGAVNFARVFFLKLPRKWRFSWAFKYSSVQKP